MRRSDLHYDTDPRVQGGVMKVLCFGSYTPESPRTRVLLRGLVENGVELVHCNVPADRLPVAYLHLLERFDPNVDAILVLHPGHHFVPLARALAAGRRLPVLFDALVSEYDTYVLDRKLASPHSFAALHHKLIDRLSLALSDVVLLDTQEHIRFFHVMFGTPLRKFRRVPVGSDDGVFRPMSARHDADAFRVVFVGTFIPLHGLTYIVRAAKLLEHDARIQFEIIGHGQTYPETVRLADQLGVKNLAFRPPVAYQDLPAILGDADVGLGIFGDTGKAGRVVPTKAFDILAMAKPLVTGRTPAALEAGLVDHENAILVEMANPDAIAGAIAELRGDGRLRDKIAANGRRLFEGTFTPKIIGKSLREILNSAVENARTRNHNVEHRQIE